MISKSETKTIMCSIFTILFFGETVCKRFISSTTLIIYPSKKPSLVPFPSLSRFFYIILYCTVLYCTILYCTVLYCTVLYCTVLYCTVLYSPLLSSPLLFILQKLTCFESLTGRARLHPDMLLSLLRRSRDSLVFSKVVFTQSCLHMAAQLEKTADESRNSGILHHCTLLQHRTIQDGCKKQTKKQQH